MIFCSGECTGKTSGVRGADGCIRFGCTCASDAVKADREDREQELINRLVTLSRSTTPRQGVLNEAGELIHSDRNVAYGPPMKNFQRIADLWNTILGGQLKEPITPSQVADMSIAIKLARNIEKPKRDNYTDIAGYAACGWECAAEESDCD